MKKIISVLLAAVMLFTCTAAFAFAEDEAPVQDATAFNGVVDVWGSEETQDALIGYDLADVFGSKLARIVDGTAATGKIVIPDTVKFEGASYKVIAITEGAFVGCRGLESLTLPKFEGFTIVNLSGGSGITNGVFVDCDPVILVRYSGECAAIDTYALLTTDNGATYYVYDIDEDVTEGIFEIVMKIINAIKAWIFKLLGITE